MVKKLKELAGEGGESNLTATIGNARRRTSRWPGSARLPRPRRKAESYSRPS